MRDVGSMGESTFSLWCAEAGLVSNPSSIDKTGWDYFVEFPFVPRAGAFADMQPCPIECKVQVKSTDRSDRKVSVSLANMWRLVKAQMPSFFVFFQFDGLASAQAAYVLHVDNILIEKVLRRIRSAEQQGEVDRIHKKTITIAFGDEHRLPRMDGLALKKVVESCVPEGMEVYVKKKREYVNSVGFENGVAQITFKTIGEENLKQLIDVSLGIADSVQVENFEFLHSRFGIKMKDPILQDASLSLEMLDIKPNASGFIRFKEDEISPSISFKCSIYISPLSALLPKELVKFRVHGDFFDFQLMPFAGKAEYSFSVDGAGLSLHELHKAVKLFHWLATSLNSIYAELDFEGFPKLKFKTGKADVDYSWREDLVAVENAIFIANKFGLESEFKISLNDIRVYSESLYQFHLMLNPKLPSLRAEFDLEGVELSLAKKMCCLVFLSCRFWGAVLGVVVAMIGKPSKIGMKRYQLIPDKAAIDKKFACYGVEAIDQVALVEEMDLLAKKYERLGMVVVKNFV